MAAEQQRYRMGCDIGGTFTDFLLIDQVTGEMKVEKLLTTPKDPSMAVLEGVKLLAERSPGFPGNAESIVHGSTLVINAIIERKGAVTGLITTKGFRDALEIRTSLRYDYYDLFIEYPKPLVPRYLRLGVNERTCSDGRVTVSLDEEDLKQSVSKFKQHGVESVAVCFLNSYANPENEKKAKALLAEIDPSMWISISSEVIPQEREYERTSTTVVNAYVKPLAERYISSLLDKLNSLGFQRQLLIMLSSGGMITSDTAKEFPVRFAESGPAAGVVSAAYIGKLAGYEHLLSFDMGGTTAKGCVIQEGKIDKTFDSEVDRMRRFKKGSGIPILIPMVDLIEIGAGGGSIAHIDDMGLMRVGPESAAALPGPACYGQGGKEPTVSDADLVLGYLNAEYFLGGKMRLDEEASRKVIEERVSKPLGLTVEQAAWGIHESVTENMVAAFKIHMAERGVDPGKFTLVGFGGGGPLYCCAIARGLGIHSVLIPPNAGIASAFGLLASPLSIDLVRTYRVEEQDMDLQELERVFSEMESEAKSFIMKAEMVEGVVFERSLDICYFGQGYSVNVPIESCDASTLSKKAIRESFESVYKTIYSRVYKDSAMQLVNLRLQAQGLRPSTELHKLETGSQIGEPIKGKRLAYSGPEGKYLEHTVYDRYKLRTGIRIQGPAIIEERESTTIMDRGAEATVDAYGILVITLGEVI